MYATQRDYDDSYAPGDKDLDREHAPAVLGDAEQPSKVERGTMDHERLSSVFPLRAPSWSIEEVSLVTWL
jgi:hypothetical protein